MFRQFLRKFAENMGNMGNGGGKLKNALEGVMSGHEARLLLEGGALCGASLAVLGVGSLAYDWMTGAKRKEGRASKEWRRAKIDAINANTAQLKEINSSIIACTEALKLNKQQPQEQEQQPQELVWYLIRPLPDGEGYMRYKIF